MAAAEATLLRPVRFRSAWRTAVAAAVVIAPVAGGLLVLTGDGGADTSRLRTFGPATVPVPEGWEASPSNPSPQPEEVLEMRRMRGDDLVAGAALLNGTFDLEAAATQNGGKVLRRSSRQVGGQRATVVESTNLTHWRYLDASVPSAGLTVSLRWDPRHQPRDDVVAILEDLALSGASDYEGPVPGLGGPGQGGSG